MGIPGALLIIGFFSVVVPVVITLAMNIFGEFFYVIGVLMFKIIELLQMVFKKLAGLGTVWIESSTGGASEQVDGDILVVLLKNPTIVDTLISVTVFAVALTIIATIVQMIRVEYTTEGSKNSKEGIIGLGLKSLVMFVLIPVVCFFGIRLSNYMLKAVDAATSQSGNSSLAGAVFVASAFEANRIADPDMEVKSSALSNISIGGILNFFLPNSLGLRTAAFDESKKAVKHFETVLYSNQNDATRARFEIAKKINAYMSLSVSDAKLFGVNGFGDLATVAMGGTVGFMNYNNLSAVRYFYSINDINYIILYFGCYLVLQSLFNASMGLVIRLYKVAALFVIAPATIGLQPLDGGNAFKSWKKSFISNVVAAYGVIVAFNLFFILQGVICKIELFDPNAWTVVGWSNQKLNSFMQALFAVIGITQIKALIKEIGGFVGSTDIISDGAAAVGDATKAVSKIMQPGKGAAMQVMGMYNSAKAGKEKQKADDKERQADSEYNEATEGAKFDEKTGKWLDDKNNPITDKSKTDRYDAARKTRQEKQSNIDNLRKRAAHHSARSAYQKTVVGNMLMNSGPVSTLMGLNGGSEFQKFATGKEFKEDYQKFNEDHGNVLKDTGVGAGMKAYDLVDNVINAASGEGFKGITAARDKDGNKIVGKNGYFERKEHVGRFAGFQNKTRGVVDTKNNANKAIEEQHSAAMQGFAQQRADYGSEIDALISNYADSNSLAGISVKSSTMTQANKAAFELLNLSSSGNLDVGTIKARALDAKGGDDYGTLNPNYSKAIDNLAGADASNVASLVDELKKAFVEDSKDESFKSAYKDLQIGKAKVDDLEAKENGLYEGSRGNGEKGLDNYTKGLENIMKNNPLKLDASTLKSLLENQVIKTKQEGEQKLNFNFDKLKSIISDSIKASKESAEHAKAAADQAKATETQTKLLKDMLKELKKKK